MIDIVVTYLYERDKQWQQDFRYWKQKEIEQGLANKDNRQAFGEERTREWDVFKYWFRGIEENCKWINKIFLVVQNKNHIPKWLNINNPKLRIVYHNEFIPKELLPTFNALQIEMYISNIKDLSNNYIVSDDDMYFLNPIAEDRFFKDNKPVHPNNEIPYEYYDTNNVAGVFWQTLNNNMVFENATTHKQIKYGLYHLPEARSKELEQKILKDYNEEIKATYMYSKFRNKLNLCACMYSDLLKLLGLAYIDDPYKNCSYVSLKSNINFDNYMSKDIVCFNDTEILDDYELTKKKLIQFLDKKLPNKSSYEV